MVPATRERDGSPLSAEQMAHLKRRKARIDAFGKVVLTEEMTRLLDLPEDSHCAEGLEPVPANT